MKRREFLKASVLASAAVTVTPSSVQSASKKPKVQQYREIGKTGLRMSDISFGTGGLPSASMILRAVDRGVTYFDTAPDYGSSEKYIGQAMKKIDRDKIVLTSKFCTPYSYPNHLLAGTKKKEYIEAVEASLKRMKTDYLDFCLVHAIGEQNFFVGKAKERLLDEEMLSAYEALKKAGKVRFLGVSSHGPNNLEDLLMIAVKSGHFDLIMPSFNFMSFPKIPDVLKEAKKRGVGVIAMKTLAGAKDSGVDRSIDPFPPAAFKWVLGHSEVSGLVITMKSVSDLNLYLSASGRKMTSQDRRVLDRYAQRFGREYCRTGCNACEASCPDNVAIASTLRYRMYFNDYGMEKKAMRLYASLDAQAKPCLSCTTENCNGACPYGLTVSAYLRDAHEGLTFTA